MMGSEHCDYGQNYYGDFMNGPSRNSNLDTPEHSSSSPSYSPSRFFEHPVSNLDTLAGVAIKYGVEVADIRRMNGLVTDRQMFALRTLRIPLPGRHPPSPSLSNGCGVARSAVFGKTPPRSMLPDILDSLESLKAEQKLSPAMQGYYGLREESHPQSEDVESGSLMKPSSGLLSLVGKSRSLANVFHIEEDDQKGNNQRSEVDFTSRIPEKILKESGISGWFSAIAGKGLALRATKASSRSNLGSEAEPNANASGLLASIIADGLLGVRKSSSTPILQDEDNNSSLSIWSGSWNLKNDLQALSNSVVAKPILDGWANPITGRKTKTALD